MREKLKKLKLILGRSVVRVLIVLVLAIVVPLISMFLLSEIAYKEIERKAIRETEMKVKTLSRITNVINQSTEWVVNSFLVNICDVSRLTDSVTGEAYCTHMIVPDRLEKLNEKDIYDQLSAFINYNTEYYSAVLILKPGVLNCIPDRGIAVSVRPGDTTRYDLLDDNNVFETPFYKSTAASRGANIKAGWIIKDSCWVMTYAVSLLDSVGNVVGEFWLDCNPNFYEIPYNKFISDENLFVGVLNPENIIVLSSNSELCGHEFQEVAQRLFDSQFSQELNGIIQENMKNDNQELIKFTHQGIGYYVYMEDVELTDFRLMVIKSSNSLFRTVNRFQHIFIWVMLGSFLLMLVFISYAFITYKRKNDAHYLMFNELNVASSIQRSFLPPNLPREGEKFPYDIYGFQRTAKSVGGDLYDYVVKDDILCFCIGDVSGKGVPAALVMSKICSLFRYIVRTESDVQKIVNLLNSAVLEWSDDSVMCTLFVGIINLENGHFEFCNAGHNPPILIRNGAASFMKVKPNMPVCVFENYPFQKECMELLPGDRIFAYTDGVPETKSLKNEFFGSKRTLNLLQNNCHLSFEDLVVNVLKYLDDFSNKIEQNDDITMLCFEYFGNKSPNICKSLHYDAVKGKVTNIVDEILAACGLNNDLRLRLAIEEPVQNIADYAYSTDGPLDVRIELDDIFSRVIITLVDNGIPFNPMEIKNPDVTSDIAQRELGGLGIYFTRQMMDELSYKYENQQNILILKYKKNGN